MISLKKAVKSLNRLALLGVVYAAEGDIIINAPPGWENITKITLPGIIQTVIKVILIAAAIIAFIFLLVGGIKWITSGGDKESTASAQKTITAALIGLVIVFAAWALIRLLQVFFGIEILNNLTIPPIPTI